MKRNDIINSKNAFHKASKNIAFNHGDLIQLSKFIEMYNQMHDKLFFTGFLDCEGQKIYAEDIIGDYFMVDGKRRLSNNRVFFCQKTGTWMLDFSLAQDGSTVEPLWKELSEYKFKIVNSEKRKDAQI